MKQRRAFLPFAVCAALGGLVIASGAAVAQQQPPSGIVPAKEDRVFNTVLGLLRASGPADGESIAGGELMVRALTEKLPVDAKLTPLECYFSGCWIQVMFGGATEAEIAKSAFGLNFEMSRDPKAGLARWTGPKGRTALLADEAGAVFEGWFVFVRSRAVSPEAREKHQIKMARPIASRSVGR